MRRWNEQLATDSPVTSAHRVAVTSPSSSSSARIRRRRGCARARMLAGSVATTGSGGVVPSGAPGAGRSAAVGMATTLRHERYLAQEFFSKHRRVPSRRVAAAPPVGPGGRAPG
ncbi:Uncharacterised protein [Mycobacteroides abscessus]|nr:Uncharacterised protein [Mycobacteroides abscessus]